MALSVVQQADAIDTASAIAVTLPGGTTNGNFLLVLYGSGGPNGRAQSLGSPWVDILDVDAGASETGSWLYAAYRPISAGENSVSLAGGNGSGNQYAVLYEINASVSGAINIPDFISNVITGTGTTIALGSVAAVNGDIAFALALFHDDDGTGFTWSNSFANTSTYREESTGTPDLSAQAAYLAITSSASYSTTASVTGAGVGNDQRHGLMVVVRESLPTTVTDVETDEEFDDKDTAVTITGTNFGATKGTGKVELGNNASYAAATKVEQTTTSWADTAIDFTASLGALTPGPLWLFVTNTFSLRNDPGFAVTVHRAIAFTISASANITASGENTTGQLAAPATAHSFGGGRIQDDENPGDAVNLSIDEFREDEWSIIATTNSEYDAQYEFRVLLGGVVSSTTSVIPRWTVAADLDRALAGIQPAFTGVVTRILHANRSLLGVQPAASGVLVRIYKALRALSGVQPSASGTLIRVYVALRSLSGSQPSATGVVTRKYAALRLLTGIQPAALGTLIAEIAGQLARTISGVQPAATATITRTYQALRSVSGTQPAFTGVVTRLYQAFRSLSGTQPSASGTLAFIVKKLRSIAGIQPAATGTLTRTYHALRALLGTQPSASGILTGVKIAYRSIAGIQPAATGTINRVYHALRVITGTQPASTGVVTRLYAGLRSISGVQPAASGALTRIYRAFRSLAGTQPSASGTIVRILQALRSLTGAQPSASADLTYTITFGRLLTGLQPAATATVSRLYNALRLLSGVQPALSATLTRSQAFFSTITGIQPAASASVKWFIKLIIKLRAHVHAILSRSASSNTMLVYTVHLSADYIYLEAHTSAILQNEASADSTLEYVVNTGT